MFGYSYIILFCLSSKPTSVRICQNLLWQFQQLHKILVIRTSLIEIHANRFGFHDAPSTHPPTLEGYHEAVPVQEEEQCPVILLFNERPVVWVNVRDEREEEDGVVLVDLVNPQNGQDYARRVVRPRIRVDTRSRS